MREEAFAMAKGWLTETQREKLRDLEALDKSQKSNIKFRTRNRLRHALDDFAFAREYLGNDLTADILDPKETDIREGGRRFCRQTVIDALAFLLGHIYAHQDGNVALEETIEAALRRQHATNDNATVTQCEVSINREFETNSELLIKATQKAGQGRVAEMSNAEVRAFLAAAEPAAGYDDYSIKEDSEPFSAENVTDRIISDPDVVMPGLIIESKSRVTDLSDDVERYHITCETQEGTGVILRVDPYPTPASARDLQEVLDSIDDSSAILIGPNNQQTYGSLVIRYDPRIDYYGTIIDEDQITFRELSCQPGRSP